MVEMKNNIRLEVTAGDTVAWNVKLNNITENLRLAYFTVRENPDDDAVIQKTLSAGITLVDDRDYRDQKTYKIQLQSEDTAVLSPDLQYMYDLKVAIGNVVKTIISGVLVVRESVTSPTQIIIDDAEVQAVDIISAEFETADPTAGIEYEQDPVANAKIGTMTDLNTTQKGTLVGAINEVNTKANNTKEDVDKILDGSLIVPNATNATNATEATNATNVTSKINDKNISDIFESNGTTAKNATNVTSEINGNNISDIFDEYEGTVVKEAKNARNTDFSNRSWNTVNTGSSAVFYQHRTYHIRIMAGSDVVPVYYYAVIHADFAQKVYLSSGPTQAHILTLESDQQGLRASASLVTTQTTTPISFDYKLIR